MVLSISIYWLVWLIRDVTTPGTTLTLFWRVADGLLQTLHQNILKKDKTVLKISLNSNKGLFLRLSVATQLSINLLFAWIQFSFFDD